MGDTQRFTLRFYLSGLSRILSEPRRFFSELPPDMGMVPPLIFLMLSGLVFTGASLMTAVQNPLMSAVILFVNAVGMAFVTSGVGYGVMVLTVGRRVSYTRFFTIYAFSSGVTILASWLPVFLWISEPWKWWLIGTGMTRSLDLKRSQALGIIGLSVGILMLFLWIILPLLTSL
ncbi:hypothetical protein DENIS_1511 [Desulfonema ishimotonii]|uniref:Yip1 domain-containing protein n=2 Tax=Desulfonema ishimotonii TaxID=45657 RepID=A0A401FUC6_9BACT|nr:hypothetical protein DENIS_1511 [Desulfonema ishimotonii]